jgi:hypothetical protein
VIASYGGRYRICRLLKGHSLIFWRLLCRNHIIGTPFLKLSDAGILACVEYLCSSGSDGRSPLEGLFTGAEICVMLPELHSWDSIRLLRRRFRGVIYFALCRSFLRCAVVRAIGYFAVKSYIYCVHRLLKVYGSSLKLDGSQHRTQYRYTHCDLTSSPG